MKFNLAHLILAFAVGVLLASGVLIPNVHAAHQPHMENALADLHSARHQLEIAADDKGGYRVQAIGTIDTAISQVQSGISFGN